jgi:hypothetical protein
MGITTVTLAAGVATEVWDGRNDDIYVQLRNTTIDSILLWEGAPADYGSVETVEVGVDEVIRLPDAQFSAISAVGGTVKVLQRLYFDEVGSGGGGGGGGTTINSGTSAIAAGTAYYSPDDFTATRSSATVLALSNLPFPPLFENFVAVHEYDGDTLDVSYSIGESTLDWTWVPGTDKTTGTLTITGANFGATSTFVVVLRGPERAYLELNADTAALNVHRSPRDFAAAWTNATTLAITGMEFDPNEADIMGVVEQAASGRVSMTYTPRDFPFAWTSGGAGSGAGTLVVTGASFVNGSAFIVYINGTEHNTSAADTARTTNTVVKHVQQVDATGKVPPAGDAVGNAPWTQLTDGTNTAAIDPANTARLTTTVVQAVQEVDTTGKVSPAGEVEGNAPFTQLTDGTNKAAIDPADTARATTTVVQAVQEVDATGKVSPAGEVNTNAPFTKITDGSQDMDLKQADTAPTTSTIVLPTQHVDEAGKVLPAGEDAASAIYAQIVELVALASGDGIYRSPHHFTAAYQSATAVDLSGGFPTINDVSQIIAVRATTTGGVITEYLPSRYVFAWSAANKRITITGAAFNNTDVFEVVIKGSQRHANDSGNYKHVGEVNPYPLWSDSAAVPLISAAQDFTAAWADLGPEIACFGKKELGIWLTIDINDSTDLQIRALPKHESGGTEEYQSVIETYSATDIQVAPGYWELSNDADQLVLLEYHLGYKIPYVQIQIKAGTLGGGTDAQVDAAYFTRGA